jgi:hypothetical protein
LVIIKVVHQSVLVSTLMPSNSARPRLRDGRRGGLRLTLLLAMLLLLLLLLLPLLLLNGMSSMVTHTLGNLRPVDDPPGRFDLIAIDCWHPTTSIRDDTALVVTSARDATAKTL